MEDPLGLWQQAANALRASFQRLATALIGGLAISFALKDILSNLVSGVLILAMRPFQIGDQIAIADTEGTVENIEVRATQIRTYDGRLVIIPNADMFTSHITNNTASPFRRASIFVHLEYREDTSLALMVILDSVNSVPGVATTPIPSTRVRDFTRDGVQIEALFWTESRRSDILRTSSAARVAIVDGLNAAGVQLPDVDRRLVTITDGGPGVRTASA